MVAVRRTCMLYNFCMHSLRFILQVGQEKRNSCLEPWKVGSPGSRGYSRHGVSTGDLFQDALWNQILWIMKSMLINTECFVVVSWKSSEILQPWLGILRYSNLWMLILWIRRVHCTELGGLRMWLRRRRLSKWWSRVNLVLGSLRSNLPAWWLLANSTYVENWKHVCTGPSWARSLFHQLQSATLSCARDAS